MAELTVDLVRRLLDYDPETGFFIWKAAERNGHWLAKKRAGCLDVKSGYRKLSIGGRQTYEHRLVWFYVYGEWPERTIDHENRNRSDNRLTNLRLATFAENNCNKPIQRNTLSGHRGVNFHSQSGLWVAIVQINGKRTAKYFREKSAAVSCRQELARIHHGQFQGD